MIAFVTTPDPNSVVAGWIPMVLIAILAIAMVFLFFSMGKQMRKIHVPAGGVPTTRDAEGVPTTKDEGHKTGAGS